MDTLEGEGKEEKERLPGCWGPVAVRSDTVGNLVCLWKKNTEKKKETATDRERERENQERLTFK